MVQFCSGSFFYIVGNQNSDLASLLLLKNQERIMKLYAKTIPQILPDWATIVTQNAE
ncbi:MAG: hypothetical protein RMY28_011805 [Nostoc sp. ChiSLP01]|nr:hypothetical protein [Nostoc sp. CmiSLP01]MDZ8285051.1 hypothetical protein [Nostoc sp. ChiSLP01]